MEITRTISFNGKTYTGDEITPEITKQFQEAGNDLFRKAGNFMFWFMLFVALVTGAISAVLIASGVEKFDALAVIISIFSLGNFVRMGLDFRRDLERHAEDRSAPLIPPLLRAGLELALLTCLVIYGFISISNSGGIHIYEYVTLSYNFYAFILWFFRLVFSFL